MELVILFVVSLSVSYMFFFVLQAQIQIVSHLQPDKDNVEEIERIYDTWIGKIGKQHKEVPLLDLFSLILHEKNLFCYLLFELLFQALEADFLVV